jgi:hypothetical protein
MVVVDCRSWFGGCAEADVTWMRDHWHLARVWRLAWGGVFVGPNLQWGIDCIDCAASWLLTRFCVSADVCQGGGSVKIER